MSVCPLSSLKSRPERRSQTFIFLSSPAEAVDVDLIKLDLKSSLKSSVLSIYYLDSCRQG